MTKEVLALFIRTNVAYLAAGIRSIGRRYAVLFSDAEIEDMIGVVTIRALANAEDLVPGDKPMQREKRYLWTIAQNVARDALRSQGPTMEIISLTDAPSPYNEDSTTDWATTGHVMADEGASPEAILNAKEEILEVMEAAKRVLSASELTMFQVMMHEGGPDEFDLTTYAANHAMTVSTARVKKSRMLSAIREELL